MKTKFADFFSPSLILFVSFLFQNTLAFYLALSCFPEPMSLVHCWMSSSAHSPFLTFMANNNIMYNLVFIVVNRFADSTTDPKPSPERDGRWKVKKKKSPSKNYSQNLVETKFASLFLIFFVQISFEFWWQFSLCSAKLFDLILFTVSLFASLRCHFCRIFMQIRNNIFLVDSLIEEVMRWTMVVTVVITNTKSLTSFSPLTMKWTQTTRRNRKRKKEKNTKCFE